MSAFGAVIFEFWCILVLGALLFAAQKIDGAQKYRRISSSVSRLILIPQPKQHILFL